MKVLGRPRFVALIILVAALAAWAAIAPELPALSTWASVALLGVAVIPATFALVWLVLPLRTERRLLEWATAGFALLALVLHVAGAPDAASLPKLAAATAAGFWCVLWFERLSWVVLVALVVPWVDAYSVWRGPTKHIVAHHEHVFSAFAYSFPLPGGAGANLGLPDLLFFAVYLGASARFGLRVNATWALMTLSFGVTIAIAVWAGLSGLPALPGLSLGLLLANGDLILAEWRRERAVL